MSKEKLHHKRRSEFEDSCLLLQVLSAANGRSFTRGQLASCLGLTQKDLELLLKGIDGIGSEESGTSISLLYKRGGRGAARDNSLVALGNDAGFLGRVHFTPEESKGLVRFLRQQGNAESIEVASMMLSPLGVHIEPEHDFENKADPYLFGSCFQAATNSIVSFSRLRFTYRSQSDPNPTVRVVDPYRMWRGRKHIFLNAWEIERDGQPSEGDGKQKTYRLDRMSNAVVLDESVDQHEYIDESIDASIRRSGLNITLLFDSKRVFEDRDWPGILSSEDVIEGSDSEGATESSLPEDVRGPRVRAVIAVENEAWLFDQLLSCNCSIVIDPADRSDYAEAFRGRFRAYVEALLS